ncbi:T9SS type A sorting domain-containing protein [Kordia sp. YSTF-M3]|uniref:T9SS type A sorting domain-containing protein n=1 Tax=Kordia aestuariivivens TaxID=2759037 RepID=A0ABR7Q4A1_9FLAO|nr:T9SS type A sorting domain-containing protein [Kordia aestuariivivens]MBC8753352.1 T9SS type A sorting domain-containing protein [Kordia aestuariivivens]
MKNTLLFLLTLLSTTFGFAQIQFQGNTIVDLTFSANGANSIYAVDIDGDGDLDIISSSVNDDKIAWYENVDGQGEFGLQKIITTSANGATSVYAGDLDGDGDMDVLSTSDFDQKIAWYENTDGQGTFGAQQIVAGNTNAVSSLAVIDIDGDGDLDILSPNGSNFGIFWYENTDGQGSFGAPQSIATDASVLQSIYGVDIDNDGDMDVLSASSYDNKIAWHENTNGLGAMGTEVVISTAVNNPVSVYASDLDNDGDMDVLTASLYDSKIAWYENTDGQGAFGAQQIISTNADVAVSVYAEDLDGDGDMDVISASANDDKVAWYENTDSQGTFGAEQLITNADGARSIHAADMDNDGDIDVLYAASQEDKIAWYENTDSQGNFGQDHIVISNPGWNKSVYAADIDGDGDLDAISGSGGSFGNIAWFENTDGQGSYGPQKIITTDIDDAESVFAIDLDGDGDIDVLSASYDDNKIAWYENTDGQGTFGPQQIITTGASNAESVYAADLDGDGDMDIVSTYSTISSVVWFENTDGQGNFGARQTITYNADFAQAVYAEDIDGDGDMDILSASSGDDKIAWYENTDGQGNFGTQQVISTNADSASSVYAIDLDGDGDIDVLSASRADDKIAWYENTDGQGTFGAQQIITTDADFATSVYAIDMDNDGDNDVISASSTDDKIAWYENTNGQGGFGVQQIIVTNANGASSVYAADVDNDGDIDILAASRLDSKVVWHENLGTSSNTINGLVSLDVNSTGCSGNNPPLQNLMIVTNNGSQSVSTFSNQNGIYQLFTGDGAYTTSIISGLPNYYTATPISQTSNFTGVGNVDTVNFCVEPTGSVNELNISVYPSQDEPRPGFDTVYQIVYNNVGTTLLSGNVTFQYDNTKLQFLNASETVNSQTANTLTFNFTGLNQFETRTIDLDFNVFPPPTTNIGEILSATATINPISGDNTPGDNVFTLNQTVIGSYDPNDIQVLEGDRILLEDADKYLHYIIRFQNTGTASAINVNVENVLDANLDWTSMQLETLSHAGSVEITNGNMVKFIFDGINLPDSTSDEPNSHGFITYKIKPKSTVAIGDIMYNTADIFFDFNPPITTNTVSTEIVETLSVNEFTANAFSIYPNPTENIVHIRGKDTIKKLSIHDLNGRLLKEIKLPNSQTAREIAMDDFSIGLYFLSIETEKGTYTHKIMKK